MRPLTAISLLLLVLLGCRETLKQSDWTKANKIAGHEQKLSHISGLVVDDKFAYVTMGGTLADQQAGTSGVRKVALDSGEVSILDDGSKDTPQSDLGGMAIDEKFVYWNAGGKILRLSKDGGTPEPVVSEHVGIGLDIAIDSEKIYWANHGYYSASSPTKPSPIYMVSKKGGNAEVFADQQHIPHSLVVDSEFVYWVTPNSVLKQAKSRGLPQVVFQATEKEGVDNLALDADNLYFAFRSAGSSRWALRKVPKEGGAVSTLDTGYSNGILIVSKGLIYFTAGDDIYSFKK